MDALRRFFGRQRLLPLTALLLRAFTVRRSELFVLRELARIDGLRFYSLRDGGLRIAIRHRSADVVTLGEVFHDYDYAPDHQVDGVLGDVQMVVDLGANIGLFGAFAASRWPRSQIVAFEPDPANIAVHERAIAENGLRDRWALVPAAAGTRNGLVPFIAGQASLSRIASPDSSAAINVPIQDVLPIVCAADLLKMDIEGGEWEILDDPRFRASPPRVLVLEYHPYRCPTADPRSAAEAALRDAHMTWRSIKHRNDGHGMLWAWRA